MWFFSRVRSGRVLLARKKEVSFSSSIRGGGPFIVNCGIVEPFRGGGGGGIFGFSFLSSSRRLGVGQA